MRLFFGVVLCTVALAVPVVVLAGGGPVGFDGVVNSIESRYHAHAMRIPFLGLISFVSRKATHEGVGNLHVANFENFPIGVDGAELEQLVEERLGSDWQRIIRETTQHGDEQTLIYMRPEGERMGLFVVDKENHEMDVVQVSVDPRHLDEEIGHYSHHHDSDDMTE
ncbi:MAG TPA: hypothetical protein VHZ28_03250 [Terracidiphilus sp.]|jgi:hypothetical protein|nr:hypothetical protein [Terracidiphilus sp.]